MSKAKDATAYPDLTKRQRAQLLAAVGIYAKHLEDLAKKAKDLGKDSDATAYEGEASQVKDDVARKLEDDTPKLFERERRAVEKGVALFLKNLRAAKGTVRALGKDELAESFEQEAIEVERDLVPMFGEQVVAKLD